MSRVSRDDGSVRVYITAGSRDDAFEAASNPPNVQSPPDPITPTFPPLVGARTRIPVLDVDKQKRTRLPMTTRCAKIETNNRNTHCSMKNRLAAFSRKVIPYHPEFRRLKLVGSTNAALLLQQLDFWFDKHQIFYKFLDAAPDHPMYKEGDSWVEELGFSKDEFRTAFNQIGIAYKSLTEFKEAEEKFILKNSSGIRVEYYYCSYIDRGKNLTYYVRNDKFLDAELAKLTQVTHQRPEKELPSPEEIKEKLLSQAEATIQLQIAPPRSQKSKRTSEEIAAAKAAKEEQKRLRAEAKAKAERERQEQIDLDNQWRYELFGGKERYLAFNAWFWGVYMKDSNLQNPGMFYSVVLNNLRSGGEKYRYIIAMFEESERKQVEVAKIEQVIAPISSNSNEYFVNLLTPEELRRLNGANLEHDLYEFCLRQMEHQTSAMRMKTIERQMDVQELRNYRRKLAEGNS